MNTPPELLFETQLPPPPNVTVRVRGRGRQVVRRVVVTQDLAWLQALSRQMTQIYEIIEQNRTRGSARPLEGWGGMHLFPVPEPRPELVPDICADIEGGDCCVCMEITERKDVRKFGCGHDTCVTCYEQIYKTTAKCPLCRAKINQVSRAPERRTIRVPTK